MVHTVGPSFAVWLRTFNGSDIVGFAIVVPGVDFDNIDLVSSFDQGLPSPGKEVLVSQIYPLSKTLSDFVLARRC